MPTRVDYLIIGQGLAGSLLAFELIQCGCKVAIVDNGLESASQVAAGLINPVTGIRLVKTSGVDEFLPIAKDCYAQLEQLFRQRFYVEKSMFRVLKNAQELSYAQKRLIDPNYRDYVVDRIETDFENTGIQLSSFGYLIQKQTGYLLTAPLLAALKMFFIAQNCYHLADIDYRDIQIGNAIQWRNIQTSQLVFCEGYRISHNPWFSWVPFQSVKGEILTLGNQFSLPDAILNTGQWLIPLSDQQLRIGASYDRENLDVIPSVAAKNSLIDHFKAHSLDLSNAPILKHQAGIRPCTLDKQPVIGRHPKFAQLLLFNGFGSKGSLLIPGYSRHFVAHLLDGIELSSQVNLQRFSDRCASSA